MTAPVLLALEKATDEERAFWQRTMGDRDQNDGDLARAQEILSKYDTINRSINLARDYAAKARLALAEAPDGQLRSLLDDLVTFTVERNF